MSRNLVTRRSLRMIALAALVVAGDAMPAPGTTRTWQGADGASWSGTGNWVGGVLPLGGDDVLMGYLGTGVSITANLNMSPPALNSLKLNANNSLGTFTFTQAGYVFQATTEIIGDTLSGNTYNQGAGTNTVTSLTVCNSGGGNDTYSLSLFGVLNVGTLTLGASGTSSGTFSQSNGTVNVGGGINVGNNAGLTNQVNMSGGTVNFLNSAAQLNIANGGAAVFTQSGGTINAGNNVVNIGNAASTFGTYILSGSGTLNASDVSVGNLGTGTFNQSGGTANLLSLYISNLGPSGTYSLSGASSVLNSQYEGVGAVTKGVFNQSGGTNSTITLDLGENAGSTASYSLSGGTLIVGNASTYGYLYIGDGAAATFTQSGGSISAPNGAIDLGYASTGNGVFAMQGGNDTVDTVLVGGNTYGSGGMGSFLQTGGTLTVAGPFATLYVGNGSGTSGYYSLSNYSAPAALVAGTEYVGSSGKGEFDQNSGTSHSVTDLYIGGSTSGSGTYEQYGGTLTVTRLHVGANGNFAQGGNVTVSNGLWVDPLGVAGSARYGLYAGTLSTTGGAEIFTEPGGTFTQSGGTLTGGITNAGTFSYASGPFNGVFDNEPGGTLLTANGIPFQPQGVINRGSLTLTPGMYFGSAAGYTFDNENTLKLAGGSLGGDGALLNNGTLYGWGTIGGNGNFINNGTVTQGAGILVLSASSSNINTSIFNLAGGQQMQVGSSLTNNGTFSLNGAEVNGAGYITNGAPGTLLGPGNIMAAGFSNAGTLYAPAGTTRITPSFTNSGLIQLDAPTAALVGGNISNTGSIQGQGKIASAITNTGTITPGNGTLMLSAFLANNGLLVLPAGGKLLVTGPFATNAGTIALQGGTLDTNSQALSNANIITGYGVLSTGGLTNNASITFTGGNTTVTGPVTNAAGKTLEARFNPVLFTGAVVNNGTLKVTSTTVTFAGSYAGTPPSEPVTITVSPSPQPANLAANDGGLTGPGGVVLDPSSTLVVSYVRQASLVSSSGTILTRPSAGGGQASVLSSLTLTGSANFDLADNNLILDAPSPAGVVADSNALRNYLFNANVTSSIAGADPQHRLGIGYLPSAALGVSSWGGQNVDNTAVLTEMTYLGDANLDGKINADDYALIDRGYRQYSSGAIAPGTATWLNGDFNYDGIVNSADYLLIDRSYLLQTGTLDPALLAAREAQFGPAYVSSLLASVPEPTAAGLLAALPLLFRRRRQP